MKRLAIVVGVAAMAAMHLCAKPGLLDSARAGIDGLFGAKFGDRLSASAAVIPSGDGTVLSPLDPKEPEFVFQEYFASAFPQTRVIVGFIGVDIFEDDELDKCNAAYNRCKAAIEKRFGKKMGNFPTPESNLVSSQTVLKNCGAELAGSRFFMLQAIKNDSGGYILRFIALDLKATKEVVAQYQQVAKSQPQLDGLFGRKLGARAPASNDEVALAGGMRIQQFEPEKRFLDFSVYGITILPQSRKICGVFAVSDFEDRFSATECFSRACSLLEKKFGQQMTDASANFDSTKPDDDGEQIFKCSAMCFMKSLRFIEVHCLKDVDDDVFRVRISAYDQSLRDALESEKRRTGVESADKDALDAL